MEEYLENDIEFVDRFVQWHSEEDMPSEEEEVLTAEVATACQQILRHAVVVLQHLALVPAHHASPWHGAVLVTEREGEVAERGDDVLATPLGELCGAGDHRHCNCHKKECVIITNICKLPYIREQHVHRSVHLL